MSKHIQTEQNERESIVQYRDESFSDDAITIRFVREQLKELIGGLEPVQRTIVLLKLGAGWPHHQVAEMLLMSSEKLSCRWAHTLRRLVQWTRHKRPELFPKRVRREEA